MFTKFYRRLATEQKLLRRSEEIIQIGKKQYAIGVTKEQITFLSELEEDQLEIPEEFGNTVGDTSFKEVMKNMLSNVKNRDDKK